ncbi:hypothetical protein K4K57_004903 [Colletotrichum sp. SAR 10_99]|nr:hypothetical protein K4K55_005060 [Colletotrichum sp. SAR 10_96]KAI8279165.1 hypothetical protein K4K56_012842 [Colletotrichum sp. SAR 10_98]KAJ5011975.1 hypothetical protein K4K57_004903 [Colletotrichum sp. SAR 10_99]
MIGLLFSLIFASTAIAEDVFRRPPGPGPTNDYSDNPIYTLGQKVTFVWESDPLSDIWIWNNKADSTTGDRSWARILQNYSSLDYTWEVSYDGFPDDADLSLPVFYLALSLDGGNDLNSCSEPHVFEPEPGIGYLKLSCRDRDIFTVTWHGGRRWNSRRCIAGDLPRWTEATMFTSFTLDGPERKE